jgi:hypothetical protein
LWLRILDLLGFTGLNASFDPDRQSSYSLDAVQSQGTMADRRNGLSTAVTATLWQSVGVSPFESRIANLIGEVTPVITEQLNRVRCSDRPVATAQVIGRAISVATPADSFRVLWMK